MTSPVRLQSPAVSQMAQDWPLIDALMGGTRAMRTAGKTYLPQWPGESPEAYQARLTTATLFPAYARTVSVLTGKPFSKPVAIGEDVPARIQDWLEDIDLQGRNLHSFAADLCAEALAYGICGILVDYPPTRGVKTVADEQRTGVRPYWVHVGHESILGWKTISVDGGTVITQLRLLENVEVPDGEFATKTIEQVRVLEPSKWTLYRKLKDEDPDSWAVHSHGETTQPIIPFIPLYGLRKAFMVGVPPMLELAFTNVEHWQSKSDQQTILHVARVPILFGKDIAKETGLTVGAGSIITADGEHADLKYVEHSGAAIEAGRVSILDLEDRMRQIGAELLVIKPGNTTVVQTLTDNEQGMCDLQRIMQGAEDALDQALELTAAWINEKEGGHVSIYSDFGAATLAEASADLLFEMKSVGALSFKTLLNELKRRGILSPDVDLDEEMKQALLEKPPEPVQTQELVKP